MSTTNGVAATSATAITVSDIVRNYLARPILGDIRLEVIPEKTRYMDGWWKVAICPSRWPERLFPLYEEMAIIEERLRDDNHLDILLALGEPTSAH